MRRELVHRLAAGPCTHSEVQECFHLVPKSDQLPASTLDAILASVATRRAAHALEVRESSLRDLSRRARSYEKRARMRNEPLLQREPPRQ